MQTDLDKFRAAEERAEKLLEQKQLKQARKHQAKLVKEIKKHISENYHYREEIDRYLAMVGDCGFWDVSLNEREDSEPLWEASCDRYDMPAIVSWDLINIVRELSESLWDYPLEDCNLNLYDLF